MSRNAESRFSHLPAVDIQRSKFNMPSTHKTTMNTGSLVPIYVKEILPGDTCVMDMASLVRMATPVFPVMDNAYLDTYFFFVPNRLTWNHWKEFMGENTTSYWSQSTEYEIPQLIFPNGPDKGSVADYMGIPTDVPSRISSLPFRAYALIWNNWFRDQNVMQPAYVYYGDESLNGVRLKDSATGIDYANGALGGKPLPVSRFNDYFSSALPAPEKGDPVSIPLFDNTTIPVVTSNGVVVDSRDYPTMTFGPSSSSVFDSDFPSQDATLFPAYFSSSQRGAALNGYDADPNTLSLQDIEVPQAVASLAPNNLSVDVSSIAYATINQLREAFQIQKILERDARSGTRYHEVVQGHFGVTNPDSRMQIPEYLGGKRIPINMDQVLQTSSSNEVSPQGNTAAFSLTTDVSSLFTKSFTEHGYLIGLACIRTNHTYQQGIERFWSRKRRFDFYWPELAHIGEQAVLKKEIYATGDPSDDEAFGYQEAWADYRYSVDRVSGGFRSNYARTLDSWHYADYYDPQTTNAQGFVIQADWLAESPVNVDRTLAVQSSLEDQFLCDFSFNCQMVRPMPVYSVPGLIDHF